MRMISRFLMIAVFLAGGIYSHAQITSKEQSKNQPGNQDDDLTGEVLFMNTTRNEDIRVFTETTTMVENAIKGQAVQEAEIIRKNLVKMTKVEIARSNHDLSE